MQPTQRLLTLANETAKAISTKNRLDPDTVLSISNQLVLQAARDSETEVESIFRYKSFAIHRLIPMVLDELRVFGPSCGALRQRTYVHGEIGHTFQRQSSELLKHVQTQTDLTNLEFLDRFGERQQQFIIFILAGYTYKELISFGFSRHEIKCIVEELENVYAF